MEIELITFDNEKWVTSESLRRACESRMKHEAWQSKLIKNLRVGVDYIQPGNDVLFSPNAAFKIYTAKAKPRTQFKTEEPQEELYEEEAQKERFDFKHYHRELKCFPVTTKSGRVLLSPYHF